MNLTQNGGRVLLGVVTAFTCMAGAVLGFGLGDLTGQPWIALGLILGLSSVGAMIGAGSIEYVRRAPHLSRVMAVAGIAGLLFSFPILAVVPFQYAFPTLSLLVAGATVWTDIQASRRSEWDG